MNLKDTTTPAFDQILECQGFNTEAKLLNVYILLGSFLFGRRNELVKLIGIGGSGKSIIVRLLKNIAPQGTRVLAVNEVVDLPPVDAPTFIAGNASPRLIGVWDAHRISLIMFERLVFDTDPTLSERVFAESTAVSGKCKAIYESAVARHGSHNAALDALPDSFR